MMIVIGTKPLVFSDAVVYTVGLHEHHGAPQWTVQLFLPDMSTLLIGLADADQIDRLIEVLSRARHFSLVATSSKEGESLGESHFVFDPDETT